VGVYCTESSTHAQSPFTRLRHSDTTTENIVGTDDQITFLKAKETFTSPSDLQNMPYGFFELPLRAARKVRTAWL
jgi:hypothetical protein